jgi:amino acid transporter
VNLRVVASNEAKHLRAAGLQGDVLSIPNGIAMAAAAMAPVLAVVLNAPAAAPSAGAALPLSFLIAFLACGFVGNTVVQFSRQIHSSGSFYAFNSQALGSGAGFLTGWMFWIGYAVLAPGLFTAFGAFTHDYVQSTFDLNVPWWVFSLLATVLVFALSTRSIKASVQVDLALLAGEVVIFLTVATIAIAKSGEGNSMIYFSPSSSPGGWSGVGLGAVFGILSFIGFDAAATLGEETKDPGRSLPIAVGGALAAVGLFYVFVMYALTAGYNLKDAAQMDAFMKDANPFVTLSRHYTPWLAQPVELAAIAGLFSCFLAIHNATVRVMFAMGRDRILPASFGTVHRAWSSPFCAIIAQTAFTIIIGLAVGSWLGPGATGAYGFTGAVGAVAVVLVYIGSNAALIRYFWRLPERNTWTHILLPLLGIVSLGYPLYIVLQPGQAHPYNLVPLVIGVWIVAGVALWAFLRLRSPEKTAALSNFAAEEEEP